MTALEYLESLIAGQKISSIPVQTCELELLRTLMQKEQYDGYEYASRA